MYRIYRTESIPLAVFVSNYSCPASFVSGSDDVRKKTYLLRLIPSLHYKGEYMFISYSNELTNIHVSLNVQFLEGLWIEKTMEPTYVELHVRFRISGDNVDNDECESLVAKGTPGHILKAFNKLNHQLERLRLLKP